jgi:hypothetical protein
VILGTFDKQPADTLDYDIDFTNILDGGDTIATIGDPPTPEPKVVTVSPSGLTLGPTFVINNGTRVKQWISGGVSRITYKVSMTVTTSAGRVKQVEFVVRVKDE